MAQRRWPWHHPALPARGWRRYDETMIATHAMNRDQVREVDRRAVEELGIPGLILMENAAINATALVRDFLVKRRGTGEETARIAIVCGGGNNGGDGYAIARHLHNRGVHVELFAAKDPAQLKGDAAVNHDIVTKMGLPLTVLRENTDIDAAAAQWAKADVVIDAMLGTGFSGEVRQPVATIIDRINELDGPGVVAIDTPSGLDCQTGAAAAATVRADLTITFVARKTGFDEARAEQYTGRVGVADIGAPAALVEQVQRHTG